MKGGIEQTSNTVRVMTWTHCSGGNRGSVKGDSKVEGSGVRLGVGGRLSRRVGSR